MSHSVSKASPTQRQWVTWALRRLSYKWPPRQAAFRKAQVSFTEFKRRPGINPHTISVRVRNFYRCGICNLVFTRKQVSADHRIPVVDPKRGFVSWDVYISRLFCDVSNFQIICDEDHDDKTNRERKLRKVYKTGANSPKVIRDRIRTRRANDIGVSESTKKRIATTLKNNPEVVRRCRDMAIKNSKNVIGVHLRSGKTQQFTSIHEAARALNLHLAAVSRCCNNHPKSGQTGGWVFKFMKPRRSC